MVEEIEIVLVIAEPETSNVALLARKLCEKRERIAAHRIECGAGENGARRERLGNSHSHVCLAVKTTGHSHLGCREDRHLACRFRTCRQAGCPPAPQPGWLCPETVSFSTVLPPFESSHAAKFRFVMPMGLLP